MIAKSKSVFIKIVALILVFSLTTPCFASAATIEPAQPYASSYLTAYRVSVQPMGSGKLQIWYEVMGTGDMDEIGTLSIRLYESTDNQNWARVKTFLHEDYNSMLAYDDFFHCSYVSYQGTAGKYYRAYICIWAGKDGSGDTRYVWTSAKRAT